MTEHRPPPPPYPAPPASPPAAPPGRGRGPLLGALLAGVLAVAVLAVAVVVALARGEDEDASGQAGDPGAATLDEVRVFHDLDATHTDGDVDYEQVPPVGGPHAPAWLDCGVYDEPVREELVVHDLEHGTVWITHDPDLPASDLEALAAALPDNGILSPHPGLPAPVVVTVWERQLELDGADDPRLGLFIETFGGGATAPEPFASCAGGLANPSGGTSV